MSCFVRTHQLEHARSFVGAIVSPCVHTVALANLTHFWAQVAREREGEKKLSFAALSGKGKGEALKIKFFFKKNLRTMLSENGEGKHKRYRILMRRDRRMATFSLCRGRMKSFSLFPFQATDDTF